MEDRALLGGARESGESGGAERSGWELEVAVEKPEALLLLLQLSEHEEEEEVKESDMFWQDLERDCAERRGREEADLLTYFAQNKSEVIFFLHEKLLIVVNLGQ